jgi:acid stress chaperone HdeB
MALGGDALMRKVAIVLAVLLAGTAPLSAQVTVDVAKISCDQFATFKVASPEKIAIWLNGYFHGQRGDTVVDTEGLNNDTKKVQQYCVQNPNVPLMQAVQEVLGTAK